MTRSEDPEPTGTAAGSPEAGDAVGEGVSRNGAVAPPSQRQGDGEPRTVRLQVGAPEHGRGAREQHDRQPVGGRAYGFSPGAPVAEDVTRQIPAAAPSTVRVGGHTPPERVAPVPPMNARAHPGRVPRRTSLQLQRLDPWSVLKISLVLSVAGFLAWMVAVGVLYGVLAGMGVWDQLNGTYSDLTSVNNPQGSTELISGGRVFGVALVVGLVNIVLMTALATVGSLIYNIASDLVGGIEVTLSEPE